MSKVVRCNSGFGNSLSKIAPVLAVMLGVLLLVSPVFAQTANGRISGTVKDQTGGAIVGAMVAVTDTARGLTRNLTTDDAGAYSAPNVLPGNYTVRATFTGFQAWERTNIAVGVGADVFVDATLVPGAQTQTVTITEELPLVNTTSSTLGGALSNETINELPVAGRNFVNIMDLRPGVVLTLGNDSGGAGAASTNGLRPENSNEYLVEGLHAMDAYTGQSVMNNFALRGDATGILSQDAIQEFNQQFNSKAEYGQRAGGATNIGLKSGTNAFHGTGFAYFRDRSLDARNYFNGPLTGQPDVNNSMQQFGGTFGGPIKKDKVFMFLSYEQQNLTFGSPSSTNVAFTDVNLLQNPAGVVGTACILTNNCSMVPNSIAGSRTPTTGMHFITSCLGLPAASRSAQSLSLVGLNADCTPGSTYPNATNGTTWFVAHGNDHGAPADPNQSIQAYFPNTQTNNRQISGVAKVDYSVNDKNTLNGFIFTGRGDNRSETAKTLDIWRTHVVVKPLVVAGTWTFLPNSAWANSFRVGYARSNQLFSPLDEESGLTSAQLGLPTGVVNYGDRNFGYPQSLSLSGFNAIGARNAEVQGPETTLEIIDQLSYLIGNHSLKFGGGLMVQAQNGATWANTKGTFAFGGGAGSTTTASGVIAFLAGQNAIPSAILGDTFSALGTNQGLQTVSLFVGDPTSHLRRSTYSGFVQDDWRIRPRLTLNLGLRYDLTTVPTDVDHILGSFDPQLGIVQEGIQVNRIHNGDHNNFAPRVGFAWDMFGTGRTVLKAGGSIVYEQPTLRHYAEVGNSPGITTPASAWVIGCTQAPGSTAATADQSTTTSGYQLAAGQQTNCPGSLTTSGGTRNVGSVSWSAGAGTLLPSVFWDGTRTSIFPSSTINNCNPNIVVRDGSNTSAVATGRAGGQCAVVLADRHFVNPYTESWNLGITQALANNLVLDVSYVGNHATKLIGRTDDNQPLPYQLWNSVVPTALLPNNTGRNALQPVTAGMTFAQVCAARPTNNNCNGNNFSTLVAGAGATAQPFNAKFPYVSTITRIWNQDTSNYHGLQVTLTARNYHGLSLTSGYTWSHGLDVVSGNGSGVGTDSYITNLDYGRSSSDLRHKFTLSPTYNFPSKMGFGGLLEGWRASGVFRYQSGRPWGPGRSGDYAGTGRTSRWDFYGDPKDFNFWSPDEAPATFHPGGYDSAVTAGTLNDCSSSTVLTTCVGTPNNNLVAGGNKVGGNYTSADLAINTAACASHATTASHLATLRAQGCWTRGGAVVLPPDVNTFGNMPKTVFDGPGYWNIDASIAKRQKFTERLSATFSAELYNVINHPNFTQPSAGLGCSAATCNLGIRGTSTPDVGATNPILGSGGPRRFQLGAKLTF